VKRIYLIFFLIFILLFSLISIYFIQVNPKFLNTKILHKVSTAKVSTQNDQLNIDFQITSFDRAKAVDFSNNLEISSDYLDGVKLTLDPASINQIKQNLPLEVNLRFSDKQLDLSSVVGSLSTSLPSQNYEIATGSSKLTFNTRGRSNFDLTITDPGIVISYATSSGRLYLSSQIGELFPMLSKIAKITLVVKDKNVTGNILLK